MEFLGDVEPFLRENDNLSPVCRASLLEIFDDPATSRVLDIELAATVLLIQASVLFKQLIILSGMVP